MKVTIYQINPERDDNRMMFMAHGSLEKLQGNSEVDSKIYDKIYEKELACNSLEEVYQMFNISRPEDFKGHSLSVSDVVEVSESENIPDGFYFCDSFGFKNVLFHPEECGVSDRLNEPSEKINVLLIEPGKYPKMIAIEDSLEAMQSIVGGYIEEYMPFEDEVALVCNEEGKMSGLPLNRAIYSEPTEETVTYAELKNRFRENEKSGGKLMTGYIVFTQDSFDREYTEAERTYVVSSRNKAFMPNMGGYSIYGSSLDGSDKNVRLEQYMADEYANAGKWKVERCYMKDDTEREMIDIIAGKFFICYAPIESEKFESLPDELAKKYEAKFRNPERFFKENGNIVAVPYKPKDKEYER